MAILHNASTGKVLATRVDRATTFLQRMVGLLARSEVRPDEGLWIDRCSAIHTMGMRAVIDVIFLDRMRCIVEVRRGVAPFRPFVLCLRAASVIELGAGALDQHDVLIGDRLELA